MNTLSLHEIGDNEFSHCGGKASNCAKLLQLGFTVPQGFVIPVDLYRNFCDETGILEKITFELNRRPMESMRWEELWDLSLKIKNIWITTPYPPAMKEVLTLLITSQFASVPMAVRSSSLAEDGVNNSFAGLHDSYLNCVGPEAILEKIKLVWASLFSEQSLMYRQELALSVENASMAILVQEMVFGDLSGVLFTKNPLNSSEMVIEAVPGLNQGLVDDTIAPDAYSIDLESGAIKALQIQPRDQWVVATESGTRLEPIPQNLLDTLHLHDGDVRDLFLIGNKIAAQWGMPMDIEWTRKDGRLYVLQCRPITTVEEGAGPLWAQNDKRPWYKSLVRSFDNLKVLSSKIQNEILPGMEKDATIFESTDLSALSDESLSTEIENRRVCFEKWNHIYWDELIPFAHGSRLFGEYYNQVMQPEDTFEFIALLQESELLSIQRNEALYQLAQIVRKSDGLHEVLKRAESFESYSGFANALKDFHANFGELTYKSQNLFEKEDMVLKHILAVADKGQQFHRSVQHDLHLLEEQFFASLPEEQKEFARDLLRLGRESYTIRDNDNIILSRVESQLLRAIQEACGRYAKDRSIQYSAQDALLLLKDPSYVPPVVPLFEADSDEPVEQRNKAIEPVRPQLKTDSYILQVRQLIGQTAGKGFARGKARVILNPDDLFTFEAGEILVCDSIDPNMTFVVPLASAIVERRGGMLVHGAIIAREYGLPCITGVENCAGLIKTGDTITVDGYVGVVTIHTTESS